MGDYIWITGGDDGNDVARWDEGKDVRGDLYFDPETHTWEAHFHPECRQKIMNGMFVVSEKELRELADQGKIKDRPTRRRLAEAPRLSPEHPSDLERDSPERRKLLERLWNS